VTIWKYPVLVTDTFTIHMPTGARILSVQVQDGGAMMWALVDPDAPKVTRTFRVAGTGHKVDAAGVFVGTFQMLNGRLVFHLFDLGEAA
jgi:hypothetical protein